MVDALVLRTLTAGDEEAFGTAVALTASEPRFAHYFTPTTAFADYVRILEDAQRGVGLPPGHVPSTLYFGFVGSEIVGRLMLRPTLNEFLLNEGGHLGYVVVPPHRRRGYATEMLRHGLRHAHGLGLSRVLVTCNEDNEASRRVIEKCGGVYEDSRSQSARSVAKRRYWIATAP